MKCKQCKSEIKIINSGPNNETGNLVITYRCKCNDKLKEKLMKEVK